MIFITGCNGLIGSYIARSLINEGKQIRALRRADSDLSLLKDVYHQIEWVTADVTDVPLLEKSLEGIEAIVHSAAVVSYDPRQQQQMYKVNVEGTFNIINAALNKGVRNFCHVSSVAAFGKKKDTTHVDEQTIYEESDLNTSYARSKYLAELEVYRGIEEGLNAFIINPSVVLGPGDWYKSSTRLFRYVYEQHVFYTTGKVNFIDVRDVADIVCKLLEEKDNISGERYILNAGSTSYQHLFAMMADRFKVRAPYLEVGKVLSQIAWRVEAVKSLLMGKEPLITRETAMLSRNSSSYDNSKIRSLLKFDFRDLDDTISWACSHLQKRYV